MGFDRLAPCYGLMESLAAGRLMQRVRTAWLEACPEEGRALLAGEGRGRTLIALRKLRPRLRLKVLDASPVMQGAARRGLAAAGLTGENVEFVTADALRYPFPRGAYQVILTPFFLDCFPPGELAGLMASLTESAAPDALWLIADFQHADGGWRRHRTRVIHWLLHAFFRRAAGIAANRWTDPAPLLAAAGWRLEGRKTFSLGLMRSDLWSRTAGQVRAS